MHVGSEVLSQQTNHMRNLEFPDMEVQLGAKNPFLRYCATKGPKYGRKSTRCYFSVGVVSDSEQAFAQIRNPVIHQIPY